MKRLKFGAIELLKRTALETVPPARGRYAHIPRLDGREGYVPVVILTVHKNGGWRAERFSFLTGKSVGPLEVPAELAADAVVYPDLKAMQENGALVGDFYSFWFNAAPQIIAAARHMKGKKHETKS